MPLDWVQAGANVDARDGEGSRPIDAAAAAGQKALVKLLLPHSSGRGSHVPSVDEVMASAASQQFQSTTATPSTSSPTVITVSPGLTSRTIAFRIRLPATEEAVCCSNALDCRCSVQKDL